MNKRYRYVTKSVTLAIGTATTEQVFKSILDNNYEKVVGVQVHEVENASNDMYKLALSHNDVVVQESTHKNDWISNSSVPMEERYKKLNLSAKEETLMTITPYAALVGQVTIDVVFKLEKDVC